MWGDRLLDDAVMKSGKWESSRNGTAAAVDLIPRDIVLCDWHYELRAQYPSVPFFQERVFCVLPASWRNQEAALALLEFAQRHNQGRVVGHLCTTWMGADEIARELLGETTTPHQRAREIVGTLRACLDRLRTGTKAAEP